MSGEQSVVTSLIDKSSSIDMLWLLICSAMVMMMQAGFCCLESGLVRSKNSINVAMKNIVDFCVAGLLYWAAGFAIMYGASCSGLFGTSWFFFDGAGPIRLSTFFIFQVMFCGAATTIVSGAVAERMRFSSYLLTAILTSLVIYPLVGHWVWGGFLENQQSGFLAAMGFIDFAGSTVVHSLGGWVALAACLVLGPRIGRFDADGLGIRGHDLPMALLGVFLLWFGWFGFNGGSLFALNDSVPHIILNTFLGSVCGGLVALVVTWVRSTKPDVLVVMNGVLAGLVAVTASADIASSWQSAVVGGIGGLFATWATTALERWKIDDAVGAIPVHLVGGVWGTIAVAFVGTGGVIWYEQLQVQVIGVCATGGWAFGVGFLVLWSVNKVMPLRVSAEDEIRGLNISEHDAVAPEAFLLHEMDEHRHSGHFEEITVPDLYSDIGRIAMQYNKVLEKVNHKTATLLQLNKDLEEARLAAEAAGKSKSDFLANMSHEIRTPMTAILGFAETLKINDADHTGLSDEQHQSVDIIVRNGEHLLSLINDILDISKLESDQLTIESIPISPREIVNDVISLLQVKADEKNLPLKLEIDENVPELIISDPTRLRQVLVNLAGNAIKFTEVGFVGLRLTADEPSVANRQVHFEVSDSGIGMTDQQVKKVFEPFSQADSSTTRHFGGTGLGLSISQRLTELLGSNLSAECVLGKGCQFLFSLAVGDTGSVLSTSKTKSSTGGFTENNGGEKLAVFTVKAAMKTKVLTGKKFLLVEDGLDNQRLISFVLKKFGADVVVQDNGQLGVDEVLRMQDAGDEYDIIFMDMQMPVLDGYAASSRLRSLEITTPIIALTAHAMSGDREKCLEAGCTDFSTKPIDQQKMLDLCFQYCDVVGVPVPEDSAV